MAGFEGCLCYKLEHLRRVLASGATKIQAKKMAAKMSVRFCKSRTCDKALERLLQSILKGGSKD